MAGCWRRNYKDFVGTVALFIMVNEPSLAYIKSVYFILFMDTNDACINIIEYVHVSDHALFLWHTQHDVICHAENSCNYGSG